MDKGIKVHEFETKHGITVIMFIYRGENDPVELLDKVICEYTQGRKATEFIDINMDNPWVRILTFGELN